MEKFSETPELHGRASGITRISPRSGGWGRHRARPGATQEPTGAKEQEIRQWGLGVCSVLPYLTGEGIKRLAPTDQHQPCRSPVEEGRDEPEP